MDKRQFLTGAAGSGLLARIGALGLAPYVTAAAGCARDAAPMLFSAPQMAVLTALVDVILPATDSPAASAANTHIFVDRAAKDCATEAQQNVLKQGLDRLAALANGQDYAALAAADQARALQTIINQDAAKPDAERFLPLIKDYVLTGYFLSEIGATQALVYDKIPGGYQGDLPLAPNQKAWAI